ncbi:hypothetical protein LIN78_02345 [Leeia sp. TBRC 13508]|uniref:hydrogenase (acceptor) n=1 Tax=Leeia speluncae TaxID=2884804 RepID=A0ABS8D2F6_9NEIS|nr:hypothetical protein [Leeia speluncae]MCB6182393.1 hypothetical protein [Leeia speluncae]
MIWLQSGGCGGCTLSLLNAEQPNVLLALEDMDIDIVWHPTLSEASLDEVSACLEQLLTGEAPVDILCLEGSVMTGAAGSYHRLPNGQSMASMITQLANLADYVVAVGTCAAYGGITASGDNLTGAVGLMFEGSQLGGALGGAFVSKSGLPVINISGCPTHPDWVLDTFALIAANKLTHQDLDPLGRPRFYADRLVHHGCDKNEFYEFKASAEAPGQMGCLMEFVGCKGTQAHADCNIRPWNGNGSCLTGGYPCINCTSPDFADPGHAFFETPKVAGFPVGLPTDMPKAWFVALSTLSKSATPNRVKANATKDRITVAPSLPESKKK